MRAFSRLYAPSRSVPTDLDKSSILETHPSPRSPSSNLALDASSFPHILDRIINLSNLGRPHSTASDMQCQPLARKCSNLRERLPHHDQRSVVRHFTHTTIRKATIHPNRPALSVEREKRHHAAGSVDPHAQGGRNGAGTQKFVPAPGLSQPHPVSRPRQAVRLTQPEFRARPRVRTRARKLGK